jgi:hypothetical protein
MKLRVHYLLQKSNYYYILGDEISRKINCNQNPITIDSWCNIAYFIVTHTYLLINENNANCTGIIIKNRY